MVDMAFRINDWTRRYEVNEKGRAAEPGEKVRSEALKFTRLKNYGLDVGPAYRRMIAKAEKFGLGMGMATFGIFCKLLEIAGDQRAEFRGWILDEKQNPLDADDLAELILVDGDVAGRALEVLTDPKVGWVDLVEYPGRVGLLETWGKVGEESTSTPAMLGGKRILPSVSPGDPSERNETKEELNLTETEEGTKPNGPPAHGGEPASGFVSASASPAAEPPDSISASASAKSSVSFRNSVSMRMIQDLKAIKDIEAIFPQRTTADDTTIRDILQQADPAALDGIVKTARQSRFAKNPIARWVSQCKRRYGYKPHGWTPASTHNGNSPLVSITVGGVP
jgi:hypothetical protein